MRDRRMRVEESQRLALSIPEAAARLGISRATAYALADAGKLPVVRISPRRLIVPRAALERLLVVADRVTEERS